MHASIAETFTTQLQALRAQLVPSALADGGLAPSRVAAARQTQETLSDDWPAANTERDLALATQDRREGHH